MAISIHELAIQKVIARRPDQIFFTTGLGSFLQKLYRDFDFDVSEDDDHLRRRPDAWSYSPCEEKPNFPGTLFLYEIEDSNPLSSGKLRDYADFYFYGDSYYLDVKLFVYDRYGEHEREICLAEYFFLFLQADAADART